MLDERSATGANNIRLLLAPIDLALSVGTDRLRSVDRVAEKLVEIHWDHVRPFRSNTAPLRQVASGNRGNTLRSTGGRLHSLWVLLATTGMGRDDALEGGARATLLLHDQSHALRLQPCGANASPQGGRPRCRPLASCRVAQPTTMLGGRDARVCSARVSTVGRMLKALRDQGVG